MLEACVREGIKKEELLSKTREEVLQIIKQKDPFGEMITEETIFTISKHIEERRKKKVHYVRQ